MFSAGAVAAALMGSGGSLVYGHLKLSGDATDGDDVLLLSGDATDGDDAELYQEVA